MVRTQEWNRIPVYKRPEYRSHVPKVKGKDDNKSRFPKPKKIVINRCPNCGVNLKVFPCLDCEINGHR